MRCKSVTRLYKFSLLTDLSQFFDQYRNLLQMRQRYERGTDVAKKKNGGTEPSGCLNRGVSMPPWGVWKLMSSNVGYAEIGSAKAASIACTLNCSS